jgi:hypothetical protein
MPQDPLIPFEMSPPNRENVNINDEGIQGENDESNEGSGAWNRQISRPKLSIRRFSETVKVPRVLFQSLSEYNTAFEHFLRQMSAFLRQMVWSWMSVSAGTRRLVWSRRDMLINGMAEFREINIEGKKMLFEMTQQRGIEWCDYITSRISDCIVAAYRSYVRAVIEWKPALDHSIFATGLQNEMVTTLFENAHLLDPLYFNNFVILHRKNIVARATWEEMIFAFFSGMIPRLGSESAVSLLNADVSKVLWDHIAVMSRCLFDVYI